MDYLNQVYFGETVYQWLLLLGLWAGIVAVFGILRQVLLSRFTRLSKRTTNRVDDVVAHLLKRTRYFFLLGFGLYVALHALDFTGRGARLVGQIVFVLFMLQVALWANSLIGLWTERYREQKLETDAAAVTSMAALAFLGRLVVWFMAVLVVLGNLGVEIAPLIAGAGIGGIAIALAVQNILGDLFASLSIVLDKPFVIGDFLNVGAESGTVEHIGLKTTRVRSISGEQIVFSNADLLNSRIRNYKRMYERRVVFTIGVTYDTPRDKLEQIPAWIREIVEREDYIRFDRAHWKSFGDSSLNYEIVYYVLGPEYNIYMDIQQRINLAIFSRFEDEGVNFAYPTQTLIVQRTDVDGKTGFLE